MGFAKRQWEEVQDRGWTTPDGFVCEECVDDDHLKELVRANLEATACSCCGKKRHKPLAARMEVLMPSIAGAVYRRFSDPSSAGVPWDDGPVDEGTDTLDMLFSLPLEGHHKLIEAVSESFHNSMWVSGHNGFWLAPSRHEVLTDSWHRFVHTVQHRTRFFFHLDETQHQSHPLDHAETPARLLQQVGELAEVQGLIKPILQATSVYRARVRTSQSWSPDAATMGAPPPRLAGSGRMNPAGISYLYTALDEGTALAEIASAPPLDVAVAGFQTTRPLWVLDLCELPLVPSMFDLEQQPHRDSIMFLHQFVEEISQPVSKHQDEPIAYVPTQVVCEWFAQVFQPNGSDCRLDGLIYPSAVRQGGKNLVLFPRELPWDETVTFVNAKELQLKDWEALTRQLAMPSQAAKHSTSRARQTS
ncbi:RES domain-containing protein [Hydrogenophaga soli]